MASNTPTPETTTSDTSNARAETMRRRQLKMDERTAEVLTRMYLDRRIQFQLQFYQNSIRENEGNSTLVFKLGALIMTISSLTAAFGTLPDSPATLHLITALLPAVASLLASFSQLYQWERQIGLYQDTILSLERASLIAPDLDELDSATAIAIYPQLVTAAEKVFEDEVNQWGQIAMGKTKDGEEVDPVRAFADQFGIDIYDESGNVDENKLGGLRGVLEASQNTPQTQFKIQSIDSLQTRTMTQTENVSAQQVTVNQPPTPPPTPVVSSSATPVAPAAPTPTTPPAPSVTTPPTTRYSRNVPGAPPSASTRPTTTTPTTTTNGGGRTPTPTTDDESLPVTITPPTSTTASTTETESEVETEFETVTETTVTLTNTEDTTAPAPATEEILDTQTASIVDTESEAEADTESEAETDTEDPFRARP